MNPIASERVRIGLSQEGLASKLDLKSRATIAAYESGGEIPSSKLIAMTRLFHCSADYLLGLTETGRWPNARRFQAKSRERAQDRP